MRIKLRHAGFTLLETILVLGIAGLIIGGIWMGYQTATRIKHQAIGEQQISDILQTARNYMLQANENDCSTNSPTAAYYYGVNCPSKGNDITSVLISKGLVPGSIIGSQAGAIESWDSTGNPVLMTEYGGANVVVYNSAANPYGSGPVIGIIFSAGQGMTPSDCSDIISAWGGSPDRVSRSGLISISANGDLSSNLILQQNLLDPANGGNLDNGAVANGSTSCNFMGVFNIAAVNLFFRLNP